MSDWGRVVVDPGLAPPGKEEGKLAKLRRTIAVMESDELPRAKVELSVLGRRVRATADDEGFFTLDLAGPLKQGNHRVNARLLGKSRKYRAPPGRLLIWPRKPGIAVISDIDDTVLQTGVTSKARMLRKVLFSNAHDLNSYSNAPSLYRVWAGRGYPVVYVSGSPFNLYPRIIGFMRLKGFPQSPLFLKNFGTDSLTEQVAYKLSRIGQAMALLPGYRFILVGDSGEKDPEVYRQVQGLHPKQVMATLIHRVTNEDMTSLRFKGQLLFNFYSGLARVLKEKGLLNAKELKIVEGTP